MTDFVTEIELLHETIRACRKCEADGFPVAPPPLAWGLAPAPFLLIGQAPGLSDWRGDRMYLGPAARKLIGWLGEAGFTEDDIGTKVYMTALTKCFPGRLHGKPFKRVPHRQAAALSRAKSANDFGGLPVTSSKADVTRSSAPFSMASSKPARNAA